MIRFLFIDLLFLATVIGGGWVGYRAWLRSKVQRTLKYEAYFSGGPLDHTTQKWAKLPERYTYVYDKPSAYAGRELTTGFDVEHDYRQALYEHQGGGAYLYVGEVPTPMTYEV